MYQPTGETYRKIVNDDRSRPPSGVAQDETARDVEPADYPIPSPLRCGLNIRRRDSISQNIQTNAAPRPTTTIKNINVNAGAVNMFNIPHAVRTACQRMISVTGRSSAGTSIATEADANNAIMGFRNISHRASEVSTPLTSYFRHATPRQL
jgi:hypothetical protein